MADEPTDLEATAAADAVEDQDDGEIVDLDEIEIDAPMLLDVNDASAAGYELSIAVAQEPGIATDVMRPDAEAPAETATASEPSIPVETGGGEVDVLGLAEPEPDRAEILEAVVYDLPTRQDDSPIETQAVILPFTPSSTAEFSPIAMGQSTADEFTGRTDAASPEFSTGQVVAFEAYTAAPIVAPIEEPPSARLSLRSRQDSAPTYLSRANSRSSRPSQTSPRLRDRFRRRRAVGRERAAGRVRYVIAVEPAVVAEQPVVMEPPVVIDVAAPASTIEPLPGFFTSDVSAAEPVELEAPVGSFLSIDPASPPGCWRSPVRCRGRLPISRPAPRRQAPQHSPSSVRPRQRRTSSRRSRLRRTT